MNKYQDASYDSHNGFIFCLYVFLQEITNVQAHYEQIKQACHVSASVSVTPVDLPAQLERALEFQQWQENNSEWVWRLVIHTSLYSVSVIRTYLHCLWLLNVGVNFFFFCILHPKTEEKLWRKGKHWAVRGGSSHVGQQPLVFGTANSPTNYRNFKDKFE